MREKIFSLVTALMVLLLVMATPLMARAVEKKAQPMTLPAQETVLVVVDMQNDFAAQGGCFFSKRCQGVADQVKTVLDKARKANIPIIYTQDYHKATDGEFRFGGRKHHTMAGTWGAEILEALKPTKADYVVKKSTFDVWFSSGEEMERILNRELRGLKYAVVVGIISDVCVYAAANGFGIRGYQLVLPVDCTDTLSDYGKDVLFYQMTKLYGAKVTDSQKLQFK